MLIFCPSCKSKQIVKNGKIHNGKQNYRCRDCGRQFVENRQCAVCYSDFWSAYEQVIPSQRHQAVGKETGQTNYIERFNCTLRQRVSRLVRKTLFFSKKIENQVGAIWGEEMALFKSHIPLARWYFVHHYNASLHL